MQRSLPVVFYFYPVIGEGEEFVYTSAEQEILCDVWYNDDVYSIYISDSYHTDDVKYKFYDVYYNMQGFYSAEAVFNYLFGIYN